MIITEDSPYGDVLITADIVTSISFTYEDRRYEIQACQEMVEEALELEELVC